MTTQTCPGCRGRGEVTWPDHEERTCSRCKGTGKIPLDPHEETYRIARNTRDQLLALGGAMFVRGGDHAEAVTVRDGAVVIDRLLALLASRGAR